MTNITEVRNVAKIFLNLDITDDMVRFNGLFIMHPIFTSANVYDPKENVMLNILESEEDLEKARALYTDEIEESNLTRLFMLIAKSYQRTFFKHVKAFLSDDDYASIWRSVWRNTEFPSQDRNLTVPDMLKIFKKTKKEYLMSDAECEMLASMPDIITVYRGVDDKKYADRKALSWTLDKEMATYFSNRFGKNTGVVLEAKIDRKDILAYFADGKEEEVVVDYNKLRYKKHVTI